MKSIHSLAAPIGVLVFAVGCTAEAPSTTSIVDTSQVAARVEAPSEPPSTSSDDLRPFDRGAAAKALAAIDVRRCRTDTGPSGRGHVTVTFANDGSVVASVVDDGPYPGTAEGGCVAAAFRKATVPPFSGGVVRVGKVFTIP